MKKGTKNLLIVGAVGSAAILGIMALGGGSGGRKSPTKRLPEVDEVFRVVKREAAEDNTEILHEDNSTMVLVNKDAGVKITINAEYRGSSLGFNSQIEQLATGSVMNLAWEPAAAVVARAESYGSLTTSYGRGKLGSSSMRSPRSGTSLTGTGNRGLRGSRG